MAPLAIVLSVVLVLQALPAQKEAPASRRAESQPAVPSVGGVVILPPAGAPFGGRRRDAAGTARANALGLAISRGLAWLAAHQDEDGHWDAAGFAKHDAPTDRCSGAGLPTYDVGITALALLAFLGNGSTTSAGPHAKQVAAAARWLVQQQGKDGVIGKAMTPQYVLDHALATWALCEAAGLANSEELRAPAQAGIDYLQRHRNPKGAWGLLPNDRRDDAAITCWCLFALRSGKDYKLAVDEQAFPPALDFLDAVTSEDGAARAKVRAASAPSPRAAGAPAAGKSPLAVESTPGLTAAAMLMRLFLGEATPLIGAGAEVVAKSPPQPPSAAEPGDLLAWYLGTHALYHMGGQTWAAWRPALEAAVAKTQRQEGAAAGTWDPELDVHGAAGGRVYATALGVLALEGAHRFARLVR